MNKKLIFSLCIISLLLLGSVQDAEASVWSDFVDWLKDVFGFSQKEAEQIAENLLPTDEGQVYNYNYEITKDPNNPLIITKSIGRLNVYEDGGFKRLEDARSLMNKEEQGYKVKLLDDDGTHKITVKNYNYTSIEFEFEYDKNSLGEFDKEVKDKKMKTKFKIIEDKFNQTSKKNYKKTTEVEIEIEEDETLNYIYKGNPLGKEFHIGETSTTIILQTADSENRDDGRVYDYNDNPIPSNPTINTYGSASWCSRMYVKFNSDLDSDLLILDSSLELYVDALITGGITQEVLWVGGTGGQDYSEESDKWSTQPCGSVRDNVGGDCNLSSLDTSAGNYVGWVIFDVTAGQQQAYAEGNEENTTYMIHNQDESNTGAKGNTYRSKEHATTSTRPILNITYEIDNDPPADPTVLANSTIEAQTNYTSEDLACNLLCDDPNSNPIDWTSLVFKDGVEQFSLSGSCTDDEYISINIESENTTAGELWACGVILEDAYVNNTGGYQYSNNVTVLTSIVTPTINFNSTNPAQTNYTEEPLACNFGCEDAVGGNTLTYDFEFRNRTNDIIYNLVGVSCVNPSFNSIGLTSENTTAHEFYSCNVNITSSSTEIAETQFSNNLTIANHIPSNLTWIAPANETIFIDSNITYNCSADDADTDTVYFEIYQDTNNPPTTLLSNETVPIGNISNDGNYWTRCRAVDVYGGQSSYTNPIYLTIDNSTVKNYTASYSASTTEGKTETFRLNVSHNPYKLNYTNATLVWQNTRYDTTQTNFSETLTLFSTSVNIPIVTTDPTTAEFYWEIDLGYVNGTTSQELTSNYTQSVNKTQIFSCDGVSNSSQALAYNLTFWDEANNTKMNHVENETNVDLEANFVLWRDDQTINDTVLINVENKTEVNICISPVHETFKTNAVLEYDKVGFSKHWYYVKEGTMSNQTQNISLYLLESGSSTGITITVVDSDGTPRDDVFISAQKYYTGLDAYTTVAMGHTDEDGEDYVYLNQYDTLYRFLITDNGDILHTSIPTKVAATSISFTIAPETIEDILDEFEDVSYTMSFDNITKNVVVTYSTADPKNFCLAIKKQDPSVSRVVYRNCNLTASTGTLIAKVNETGTFQAIFYAYNSPQQIIDIIEIINGAWQSVADSIGMEGIAYTMLLTGVLAGMGLAMGSAILAIVGVILGTAVMSIFGFIKVSYAMIIVLFIIGAIAIMRLRER